MKGVGEMQRGMMTLMEDIHGDTLGVNGSEVSVLEQGDKVGLSSFLKSHDGRGLETQVGLRKTQD